MFIVSVIKDTLRIEPTAMWPQRDSEAIVIEALNRKYADRVIPHLGLVITTLRIDSVGDFVIYPGDGASHVMVQCRLMVFRPMDGELLEGRVKSQDEDGITVSLGFFEDVRVPKAMMLNKMDYVRQKEGHCLWTWYYGTDDATSEWDEYVIEKGDWIRFKVYSVNFTTTEKNSIREDGAMLATTTEVGGKIQKAVDTVKTEGTEKEEKRQASEKMEKVSVSGVDNASGGSAAIAEGKVVTLPSPLPVLRRRSRSFELKIGDKRPAPMGVVGTIAVQGLGPLSWWM